METIGRNDPLELHIKFNDNNVVKLKATQPNFAGSSYSYPYILSSIISLNRPQCTLSITKLFILLITYSSEPNYRIKIEKIRPILK